MRPLLVLRPEPGATATARRAEALGLRAIVAPLFAIEPLDWQAPAEPFDALMWTSANAVRATGERLAEWRDLPAYAVGAATAEALRAAGIQPVWIGEGNAGDLVAALDQDGRRTALHLTGADFRGPEQEAVRITHLPIYNSVAASKLPAEATTAMGEGAIALLHSPRAAALFASFVEDRGAVAIGAISPAAAAAAGEGWRAITVAAQPSDQALLAAAARLCESDGCATVRRG